MPKVAQERHHSDGPILTVFMNFWVLAGCSSLHVHIGAVADTCCRSAARAVRSGLLSCQRGPGAWDVRIEMQYRMSAGTKSQPWGHLVSSRERD